jgi:hypothetical protein
MLIKKYLILLLVLLICAGQAFTQRHDRDSFDYGNRGIGNEPFSIPDGPGLSEGETGGDNRTGQAGVSQAGSDEEGEEGLVSDDQKGGTDSRITFRANSRMVLVPLQMVSRDTAEHKGNVWLGTGIGTNPDAGIRTGLSISGNHEGKLGFRTDISLFYTNNQTNLWDDAPHSALDVRLGEFGNIWLRPTDWFRFDIGRFSNYSQSGYIDDHWLSSWSIGMFDGGNIFSPHFSGNIGVMARFNMTEDLMSKVNLPEIKGLSFYIFIPNFSMPFTEFNPDFAWLGGSNLTPGGDVLNSDDSETNRLRAFRVFQRTWFTAGYKISDEMHVRAQFIGANPGGSINWSTELNPYRYRVAVSAPRIETAFAYSTDDFGFDLGLKTWLPVSNWVTDTYSQDLDNPGYIRGGNPGTFWGGLGFGFGAFYKIDDNIRINFRADGDMLRSWTGQYRGSGVDTTITNPTRLSFHLWPSYTLSNGMVLMVACGLNYVGRNTVDIGGNNPNEGNLDWERSNRFRLGGGVSLAVPLFGAGSMNVGLAYGHGTEDARGGEPRTITIPISFFLHM